MRFSAAITRVCLPYFETTNKYAFNAGAAFDPVILSGQRADAFANTSAAFPFESFPARVVRMAQMRYLIKPRYSDASGAFSHARSREQSFKMHRWRVRRGRGSDGGRRWKCIRGGNNAACGLRRRGLQYGMQFKLRKRNYCPRFITVTINNSAHISRVSNHSSAAPPLQGSFANAIATCSENAAGINASLNRRCCKLIKSRNEIHLSRAARAS